VVEQALGDELDLLPQAAEVVPEPLEAVVTLIDRRHTGEQTAGAEFKLGGHEGERRV
jgi:hypothetical protein